MADTIYTPDGKAHVLMGSTTAETLVREYAGNDLGDILHALEECNAYEEARAETDLGAYEASLEHWRRMAQDWVDELRDIVADAPLRSTTKARMAEGIKEVIESIEIEL